MRVTCRFILIAFLGVLLSAAPLRAADLGSTFLYDGRVWLEDQPLEGACDMQFRLFDAPQGGHRLGAVVTKRDLRVEAGRFSTPIDFGANAFLGEARWLEITMRDPISGASGRT